MLPYLTTFPENPLVLQHFTHNRLSRIRWNSLLRQVLFDIRAGNSNLAKSPVEKRNHAMYQDENPHRCLISLQN